MSWNLGDLLEAVADTVPPDHTALIHDDRPITWSDLDRRANNVARALLALGCSPGDKVAFFLRNHPAYLETLLATFKSRLVHVNINYRLKAPELQYLLEDSDSRVVVYGAEFRPLIAGVRPLLPEIRAWIEVGGEGGSPQAISYESLAARGDGSRLKVQRSPDDILLIYTGGTTGKPKGVMWTHGALLEAQFGTLAGLDGRPPPATLAEVLERVRATSMHNRQLPAAPLMHATAMVVAVAALVGGGSVVTLADRGRGFEPRALLEAIERHRVTALTLVGDSFARPLLEELDANGARYRLDSLRSIVSSGVIWSTHVKEGLLRHLPQVTLLDTLSSSEAPSCGTSLMSGGGAAPSAFRIGSGCKVFSDDGREIVPGSGEPGLIARSGPLPLGYYKDPEKTARTFRTIGGIRYAIPGDYCLVEADGTLRLLGRGSQCVNTGGEKVFVEEVEEALKRLPAVRDAMVIGIADPLLGQSVLAVVATTPGMTTTEETLRSALRADLAGYKIPKRVVFSDELPRLPNGKADYRTLRDRLGLD